MPRNNIKLLTNLQLQKLNDRYKFSIIDDKIAVSVQDYNRLTLHDIDKSFSINSKIRKVTITKTAIKIWLFVDTKYSLLDIQQAVNYLFLTYQTVDTRNVLKVLENGIKTRNYLEGEN